MKHMYTHKGEKKDKPRRRLQVREGEGYKNSISLQYTRCKNGEDGKVCGDEGLEEC